MTHLTILTKDEIICVTGGSEKMDITSPLAILKLRQESLSRDDVNRLGCIGGIIMRHASVPSSQNSGVQRNMTQFFNEIKSHPNIPLIITATANYSYSIGSENKPLRTSSAFCGQG